MTNKDKTIEDEIELQFCGINKNKFTKERQRFIINNLEVVIDIISLVKQEALAEKGLIKIEDVNKVIDNKIEVRRLSHNRILSHYEEAFSINDLEDIKQQLQELKEKK